jgi:hypothetical protein
MLTCSVQLDTFQPGWLTVPAQVPPNAARPVGVRPAVGAGPAGPDADRLPPDGAGCAAVGLGRRNRAVVDAAGPGLDDGPAAGVGRRLPVGPGCSGSPAAAPSHWCVPASSRRPVGAQPGPFALASNVTTLPGVFNLTRRRADKGNRPACSSLKTREWA